MYMLFVTLYSKHIGNYLIIKKKTQNTRQTMAYMSTKLIKCRIQKIKIARDLYSRVKFGYQAIYDASCLYFKIPARTLINKHLWNV